MSGINGLYRQSYSLETVPKAWREANVQPLPKKGDRSDLAIYRPIVVTSTICKVIEWVNKQMIHYLEEDYLLNNRQCGFKPNRSTGGLLEYITHLWGEAVVRHGKSLAISLDMAKAFDRIRHHSRRSKLPAYGLLTKFCSWVAAFLH